jgi:hypothetical protein
MAVCGQARFHRQDPLRIDQAAALHAFSVLFRHQVVGDDGDVRAALDEARNELLEQCGLARADGPTDTDACCAGVLAR